MFWLLFQLIFCSCSPFCALILAFILAYVRHRTAAGGVSSSDPYSSPSPHRGQRRIERRSPYSSPSPHRGWRRIERRGKGGTKSPRPLGPFGWWVGKTKAQTRQVELEPKCHVCHLFIKGNIHTYTTPPPFKELLNNTNTTTHTMYCTCLFQCAPWRGPA